MQELSTADRHERIYEAAAKNEKVFKKNRTEL